MEQITNIKSNDIPNEGCAQIDIAQIQATGEAAEAARAEQVLPDLRED